MMNNSISDSNFAREEACKAASQDGDASRRGFPRNKIILCDGRMLDCYPLAAQAPEKIEDDHVTIDLTGQYLSFGGRKLKPTPPPSQEKEEQKLLFVKNAFYLLAHKERILSDSRMFLCPVAVQNGLAYTGISGFRRPTLGIYLEWWSQTPGAMRTDKEGRKSLVYYIAGSPLTGANRCGAVREDGVTEDVTLLPFWEHWRPFTFINNRYTEAKQLYQAYTLQEVLDILGEEENGNVDYSRNIEIQYMTHEIEMLNRHLARLKEERDEWHMKYEDTLTKYNATKIRQFYAEFRVLEMNANMEIDYLKEQKRDLKAELKAGRLDNITYQHKLMPFNKRIKELESEIRSFKYQKVIETFPDRDITFKMIEDFCNK